SAEADSPEEADAIGRRSVLDLTDDENIEGADITPGSDPGSESQEEDDDAKQNHRRLLDMARGAEKLMGAKGAKMQKPITLVPDLHKAGFHPIVFCRFIPTAEYVAESLRAKFKSRAVEVAAVTGLLPPEEREERIAQLAAAAAEGKQPVLVCTDCLS